MENNLTTTSKFDIVSQEADTIADELLACTDASQFNQIINSLNNSLRKKELLRTALFYKIQDRLGAQLLDRVINHADEFSNKDLLEMLKAIQSAINTGLGIGREEQSTPTIAIQQNTFVSADASPVLGRQERENVKAAVDAILAQSRMMNQTPSDIVEGDYKEKTEE